MEILGATKKEGKICYRLFKKTSLKILIDWRLFLQMLE
jgi:hypothetical protein